MSHSFYAALASGFPANRLLVDELPRNAMGKVQKNLLRQAHAGLYGVRA
jgi:acyl-coenzyme A synthetase/AMP-(fatty) acid ligase